MPEGKENNCRLCLQILHDDYTAIDETIRDIFEVLLLKVDLSVSKEPAICKSCMESIQEAFDFKSSCFAVEKLASLTVDRNSAELDMRDVYLNENENKCHVFNEDYNICRFCLQCLDKNNFTLLNDLKEGITEEMLLQCIPELHLSLIKDPVVCAACIKSLERYYIFATKFRNTEENIMKYSEVQGAECNGQINLCNVLNSVFKVELECIGNFDVARKKEDNICSKEEDTYFDINKVLEIQKEEPIIKDENEYLDYEMENDRCGEIKPKEVVRYDTLIHKDSSEKHKLIRKVNAKGTVYKCILCSYETRWKGGLRNHMLIHKDFPDVIMYKCEKCTFETNRVYNLQDHMLNYKHNQPIDSSTKTTNRKVTMHKCDLCSYESKRRSDLKRHVFSTHKYFSDVVLYRCGGCTFETKHKESLKRHRVKWCKNEAPKILGKNMTVLFYNSTNDL